jgi:hypothetical protein
MAHNVYVLNIGRVRRGGEAIRFWIFVIDGFKILLLKRMYRKIKRAHVPLI